jgi:hypothetical protein
MELLLITYICSIDPIAFYHCDFGKIVTILLESITHLEETSLLHSSNLGMTWVSNNIYRQCFHLVQNSLGSLLEIFDWEIRDDASEGSL